MHWKNGKAHDETFTRLSFEHVKYRQPRSILTSILTNGYACVPFSSKGNIIHYIFNRLKKVKNKKKSVFLLTSNCMLHITDASRSAVSVGGCGNLVRDEKLCVA